MILKKKKWFIKWSNREYWPGWILYVPVFIQHFWLSLKVRNLFFFLRTNPAIDGFILGDSKHKTMELVPEKLRPKSILISPGMDYGAVEKQMKEMGIDFPVILKPNIGYRGLSVRKVENPLELRSVLSTSKIDNLLQEYVDYPMELGVFYYRLPSQKKGRIPSITVKEFLSVTGNNTSTLRELVYANPRAILQEQKLKKKFPKQWNQVLPEGYKIVLEDIGNHNRGTKFINGNELADDTLHKVFDTLNSEMNGFYYGRFDLKTKSLDHLRRGGEFKILEINGVGGEPTHVYDPSLTLWDAWKDMLHIWKIGYIIACENIKKGCDKPTFQEANSKWKAFKNYRKIAFTK